MQGQRNRHAQKEERADAQRGADRGIRAPATELHHRQLRRHGRDKLLAEKERQPAAENDHGDTRGHIVHPRQFR
jgi:hypothetical protein